MPSPLEHLSIADAVMANVPTIHPGPFLAGAIAPDVDKLLGRHRSSTHWWLPGSDVSGALRLVQANPRLAHATPGSTSQAFIAGFLCHLVADEQWTLRIYRKHFGRLTPFAGSRDGADHQLALQSTLDTELVTRGKVEAQITELSAYRASDFERDAYPVLGGDAWALRPFVTSVMQRAAEPDPALRLKLMADARGAELRRSSSAVQSGPTTMSRTTDDPELMEAFLTRLPRLALATRSLISMREINDFRTSAIRASTTLIAEFIGGEPLNPPDGTSDTYYFGSPARTAL
jgi:hypothetical protein